MITLEKIISDNLEMLKSQEAELLASLSFIQKAKKLFESQNEKPSGTKKPAAAKPAAKSKHKGRPKGAKNKPKQSAMAAAATPAASKTHKGRPKGAKNKPKQPAVAAAAKPAVAKPKQQVKKASAARKHKEGTHIANIINALKQKGEPMTTGEISTILFEVQTKDKDINHFRHIIYNTVAKNFKRGVLKRTDGKIHLPA